jgi:hypothetical protein
MITKRSMLRVVPILAFGLLSVASTESAAQRSEIEILSYEIGLSQEFLEEFENRAQDLNIGSAQSRNIIRNLNWQIRELKPGSSSDYQLLSAMGPGAELFTQQLIGFAGQGNVGAAVKQILRKMHDESPPVRRTIAQAFRIPERLGLFYEQTSDIRSEIAILSYETTLSEQFLEEFHQAAENLHIGSARSLDMIKMLSAKIRDLPSRQGAAINAQLSKIAGGDEFARQLVKLVQAGKVEAAVDHALRKMHDEELVVRHALARAFGIPDRLGMLYDELEVLRKETSDKR